MEPGRLAQLKRDVREALLNNKVIAFPIACRVAWHASIRTTRATAQAGPTAARCVRARERAIPRTRVWASSATCSTRCTRNTPTYPRLICGRSPGLYPSSSRAGRTFPTRSAARTTAIARKCPAHGRLPDASQGATHLRDVFHRMGLADRDIVALSGAHTLGRCHFVRSGYDGKWTRTPLRFDNEYFRNLITLTWKPRDWDGQLQYTDVETGELMMLPTDMALKTDPDFREYAELYARDQEAFFRDFSAAYSKLLSLGTNACPHMSALQNRTAAKERDVRGAHFREAAMHGVVDILPLAEGVDVNAGDPGSGRTALHKAAYWGHAHSVPILIQTLRCDPNRTDSDGDTALHDAARFGHVEVVKALLAAPGMKVGAKNNKGLDAHALAVDYGKPEVAELIRRAKSNL